MGEPRAAELRIEDSYFHWLCAKVLSINIPNYFDLMRILHGTEFVWVVSGDKNRAADGLELRIHFLRASFLKRDQLWYDEPCSVLEALIALAQRASFQTDDPVEWWFWQFMTNLGLDEYRQVSTLDAPVIEDILYTFIWRIYNSSGDGGLFPLRSPQKDQRTIELWYQLSEYIEEQELI